MRVLAIDPSLTRSGVVYDRKDGGKVVVTTIVPPKGSVGCRRLVYIRDSFLSKIMQNDPDLVVIENYSMGSQGRVFHIGELGGVLKVSLFEYDVPVLLVPPNNLKLFATGKGNADKKQIRAAVEQDWGLRSRNSDEADAFVLYKMGQAVVNEYKVRKQFRKKALIGCEFLG